MSPDGWIGWDLGGAHLKAVWLDETGCVRSVVLVPCPLWQGLDRLDAALDQALDQLGRPEVSHAMTMTGELADLFEDRAQGVDRLVGCMRERLADSTLLVYAGAAGLIGPNAAMGLHTQVASANWMATAALAATQLDEGLVVDVGSTTTDLAPFLDREVLAWGTNDHERLLHGELVYSAVVRTPVMTLAQQVPFDGAWVPLMAEHFATTADVYRLSGDLPERADLLTSADGREKTPLASARRLARMLGLDMAESDLAAWTQVAHYLAECQLRRLADAATCIGSRGDLSPTAPIVGAGVGRFLASRLAERLGRPYVAFDSLLRLEWSGVPNVSDCAPAAAVASLAAETYP